MGRRIATTTFLSSLLVLGIQSTGALVTPQSLADRPTTRLNAQKKASNTLASTILATSVLIGAASWAPAPVQAYVPSDYASDTVQEAVQALKAASGDSDATFKAYENIAGIITEGKGVGGMVNYSEYRFVSCAISLGRPFLLNVPLQDSLTPFFHVAVSTRGCPIGSRICSR
jgi:hypothetical protein